MKLIIQVVVFAALIFLTNFFLFHNHLVFLSYFSGGMITILAFFIASNRFFHWWNHLTPKSFENKLFLTSLIIRIVAATGLYYFYLYQTGEPFEYFAIDSKYYHTNALLIAEHFRVMDFNVNNFLGDMPFSDRGYNIYLGVLYTLFGPTVIIPRLINTLFSAFTVTLIYRITRSISNEHAARLAGITAMLLPNFLLYLGTGLKETIMLFLVTAMVYQSVQFILLHKRTPYVIVSIVLLLYSLFMFRTVLAAVLACSFILYGVLTSPVKNRFLNTSMVVVTMVLFAYLIWNSQAGNEISGYLAKSNTVADHMQYRASRDGGNKLALMAGAPLFISIILIAPFPSFIYVPEQDPLWMFIGANFIRNIYAWFAIMGIIYCFRKDFRKSSMIIIYTLGYLVVLANSGFAISERFHIPAVPGLIILSAIGLTYHGKKAERYFPICLMLTSVLIIGWNYIKLAGRS